MTMMDTKDRARVVKTARHWAKGKGHEHTLVGEGNAGYAKALVVVGRAFLWAKGEIPDDQPMSTYDDAGALGVALGTALGGLTSNGNPYLSHGMSLNTIMQVRAVDLTNFLGAVAAFRYAVAVLYPAVHGERASVDAGVYPESLY